LPAGTAPDCSCLSSLDSPPPSSPLLCVEFCDIYDIINLKKLCHHFTNISRAKTDTISQAKKYLQTLSQEPGQIYRHYLKSQDRFTNIISRAKTDL